MASKNIPCHDTADSQSAANSMQPELLEDSGQLDFRWWLLVSATALTAVIVPFFKLGDYSTFSSHETYAVVPAREMMETGDWIVPRFGGVPRLKKPPLGYWVVAASAYVCGELNEWSARLPAAVSSLLLATLIGVWAGRWYGRGAGIAAALAQVSSVYAINFSRKAEVDMLLCLITTACMYLIANQQPQDARGKTFLRWIGIFTLLGFSWLAKFHYGAAMVLTPTVLFFVLQRRYRELLCLLNPVGLVIFGVLASVWSILLLRQIPDAAEIWRLQTVGRFVGELRHERHFWYYPPQILLLMLPWTPFALAGIPRSWRRAWREQDPRERFLWVWFLTQLLIVTVSAMKNQNYIFSALPMLAILAGRTAANWVTGLKNAKVRLQPRHTGYLMLVSVLSVGLLSFLFVQKWPSLTWPILILAQIMAVAGCAAAWLLMKRKLTTAIGVTFVAFVACYMGVNAWIIPCRDHRASTAEFAQGLRSELPPGTKVLSYVLGKHTVVFYIGSPVRRVDSYREISEELNRCPRVYVLAYRSVAKDVILQAKHYRFVASMKFEPGVVQPKHEPLVLVELSQSPIPSETAEKVDDLPPASLHRTAANQKPVSKIR